MLDPGDEIVCGWPSFPSYVIDAQKLGAEPRLVPLRDHRYDLDAMLGGGRAAHEDRLRLPPEQPDGHDEHRAELDAYFAPCPSTCCRGRPGVLRVRRRPRLPGRGRRVLQGGRNVLVLRTFSKIYGLAGLRVGYGVGPRGVSCASRQGAARVRRDDDGQEAALASLGDAAEIERGGGRTTEGRAELARRCSSARPRPGRRRGRRTSSTSDIGEDATTLFESLLREGVIVRPLAGFGAPEAVRVTVGTPEDHAVLDGALSAVVGGAAQR